MKEESKVSKIPKLIGWLLIIISIGTSLYIFEPYNAGEFIGRALIISFGAVFFICIIPPLRRRLPFSLAIGFIFFCLLVLQVLETAVKKKEVSNTASVIMSIYAQAMAGEPIKASDLVNVPEKYRPGLNLIQTKMNAIVLARTDFQKLAETEEFRNLLLPNNLAKAETNPLIISKARLLLKNVNYSLDDFYENMPSQLLATSDNDFIKGFVRGFNVSKAQSLGTYEQYVNIENSLFDRFEAVYELCIKSRPKLVEGKLYFKNDLDLAKYNKLAQEIIELANKETDIVHQIKSETSKKLKNFSDMKNKY